MVQKLCSKCVKPKGLGDAVVCCDFIYSWPVVSGVSSTELLFCHNVSSLYLFSLALCPHVLLLVFFNCAPSTEPSQHMEFFVFWHYVWFGGRVREYFTIIDLKNLAENGEEAGLPVDRLAGGQTVPVGVNVDIFQWSPAPFTIFSWFVDLSLIAYWEFVTKGPGMWKKISWLYYLFTLLHDSIFIKYRNRTI